MKTPNNLLAHKSAILRLTLLGGIVAAAVLVAADSNSANTSASAQCKEHSAAPAKLVQLVRDATRPFIDVNAAAAAGYQPFLGCVTGPDYGAMGVHYVNGDLLTAGEIDASHPQALIYEPSDGGMRLVGVEFIVDQATWLAHHNAPPVLQDQVFQLVASPNRFNLPTFFELHVWAWRDNPNGAFVDWNSRVTCEGQ